MTSREVFDTVKAHLLKQNNKSKELGQCMYRGPNGLMCAVGCLIPDDKYNPSFEGRTVNYLPLVDLGLDEHFNLLQLLQRIHDIYPVDRWKDELNKLEKSFDFS